MGFVEIKIERKKGKKGKKEITIQCDINKKTKGGKEAFNVMEKWKNILFKYFMEEIFQASNFKKYNKNITISVELSEDNDNACFKSKITSDNPIQIGFDYKKK